MAISLQNSWNVPPSRWGSFADVQHAIKVNSEKIYGINSDKLVLSVPGFWGLPLIDYSGNRQSVVENNITFSQQRLNFNGTSSYINLTGLTTGNAHTVLTNVSFAVSGTNSYLFDAETGRVLIGTHSDQNTLSYHDGFEWKNSSLVVADGKPHFVCTATGSPAGSIVLYVDDNIYIDHGANINSINGDISFGSRYSFDDGFIDGNMTYICIYNQYIYINEMPKFYELPYGLYQKIQTPFHLLPITAAIGWTGKLSSITNPAKINGVAAANITKVMGI